MKECKQQHRTDTSQHRTWSERPAPPLTLPRDGGSDDDEEWSERLDDDDDEDE
jgi:hypothetical protein